MLKVKDIMSKAVVSVSRESDVREVCALLTENKLSGLPVVDKKGALVGFISERDIISAVNRENFPGKKAKDIMVRKVVSVSENMSVEEAGRIFTEKPYRCLPVTRAKKIVGIISRKDVINRLLSHYY